jgi:hypothetical protein
MTYPKGGSRLKLSVGQKKLTITGEKKLFTLLFKYKTKKYIILLQIHQVYSKEE